MHNMAPGYTSDLLTKYIPPRNLRSANKSLLQMPVKVKTHTYMDKDRFRTLLHIYGILFPKKLKTQIL